MSDSAGNVGRQGTTFCQHRADDCSKMLGRWPLSVAGPMTTFRCWPDTCFPTLHRQINSGGKIISLSISFKRFPSPALFQTTVTVCKFCLKVSFLSFTHSKPFRPWVPYCWIVWRHSFAYHTWLPQNSWSSGLVGQNYAYLLVYKGHKVSASVSNCTTGAVGLGPIRRYSPLNTSLFESIWVASEWTEWNFLDGGWL